jgi:glycosyltransferase involved in cell wall biosynthesis
MSPSRAASSITAARRAVRLWQESGSRELAQRVARAAYRELDAASLEFPLALDDIADSRQLSLGVPDRHVDRSRRLRVGWVSTPPAMFSGGHTTMFRMVAALEAAGHECTMFLYDRYGGDVRAHEAAVRRAWPWVRARIVDAAEAITGMDACVATSWGTAHILARRGGAPMRRFYLVQDFEPFFYPRGAEYALAEDTYRFGFRCVAVGHMVAGLLRERIGVSTDVVEFGCDSSVYSVDADGPRDGVVFYTKPHTARRGFLLGSLALQEVHRRRPEVPIHTVGHAGVRVPFPAIEHGAVAPHELARIYNGARAGIALSFTNVSLLAEELLACGTVAVINDHPYARADVRSDQVRWGAPTPSGIADAVLDVIDAPPDPERVAASARDEAWRPGQAVFLRAIEEETYGP